MVACDCVRTVVGLPFILNSCRSRLGLILFPFVWLLILLLRIGETCDSLNSGILDALIIVIPTAHTYLSLRQVNVWCSIRGIQRLSTTVLEALTVIATYV